MSVNIAKPSSEGLFRLSSSGLKDRLSPLLEEIRRYGVEEFLGEYPDFLGRLLERLKQEDAAGLFSEVPGLADRFTSLLWEGVVFKAGESEGMKSVLENSERDFRCNIEASDSPFRGHFEVKKGKIHGTSGLVHFRDEDFRFMGPTGVLLALLTGSLPLGFGNLRLQTAGHPGWLKRIAPVMREMSRLINGG